MTERQAKAIAARLRLARKQAGLTQEDAARHLDCARQVISAIERGRGPTFEQFYELLQLYGVSADAILFDLQTIPVGGSMMAKVFRDRILAEVDQPPRL